MRHGGTPKSMVINGNIRGYYEISTAGTSETDGVMAVALVAGMSAKSFADEGLLNKLRTRHAAGRSWNIRRLAFRASGKSWQPVFEVDFAGRWQNIWALKRR